MGGVPLDRKSGGPESKLLLVRSGATIVIKFTSLPNVADCKLSSNEVV